MRRLRRPRARCLPVRYGFVAMTFILIVRKGDRTAPIEDTLWRALKLHSPRLISAPQPAGPLLIDVAVQSADATAFGETLLTEAYPAWRDEYEVVLAGDKPPS